MECWPRWAEFSSCLRHPLALSTDAPAYGYPNYPVYGFAPYSYGVTDRVVYQPEFDIHHPWEHHHDDGHHTVFYHGPQERAPHAAPEGGHPEGGRPQGYPR